MKSYILIDYAGFCVEDFGFGMKISDTCTNKDIWLQGDDANLCRDELVDLLADNETDGTRANRFSKAQIMNDVLGVYFS